MPTHTPDLTKQAPRSPRVRLGGFVLLPRILDKARASLAGKNGEYNYNCPLDQRFLGFVNVDAEAQAGIEQRLVAAGYTAPKMYVLEHGYCRSVYVADPNGLIDLPAAVGAAA